MIGASAAVTAATEGIAYLDRLAARRGLYRRARERAANVGRPLVVVGAPSGGIVTGAFSQYNCGDLPCVDLGGCAQCGAAPTDLTEPGAIPVEDDGAVVFVSFVLEYVHDLDAAIAEVMRAAGSPSNVYVAYVQDWAPVARIVTGARYQIDQAPPQAASIVGHRIMRPPRDYRATARRARP